ncbi:hypothetical protein E4U36_005663 [Claviceps purpurea]|nr:hypothetical protein E4U36_005663 [Claviceps purpurea]
MSNVIARCGRYLSDLLLGEIVAKGAGARLRSQDRNPRPENNNHKIRRKQKKEKQENNPTTPDHQPPIKTRTARLPLSPGANVREKSSRFQEPVER